ncbi:thiamine pyrophosphate-dependent enzyme [Pseudonocardia benzenivorans]
MDGRRTRPRRRARGRHRDAGRGRHRRRRRPGADVRRGRGRAAGGRDHRGRRRRHRGDRVVRAAPRRPAALARPGVFGTLGVGAGFALGAATVHPDAPLWIVFGDGSVGYSLSEFDTFVRHGIGVVAVVGNDASWSQIAREQVELLRDDVATVLAPTRYDQVAAGFGAVGLHVDDAAELPAALAKAKAADGPVLVDVRLGRSDFRKGSISM